MNKKYAIFDWDNTVRDGFTLFDWIDFLIDQNVLCRSLREKIDELSYRYNNNYISHDDYARLACNMYVKEIRGYKYEMMKDLAKQYIHIDKQHIYDGMHSIFNLLYENNTDIIILSGAPKIVLELYEKEYHICSILAFKERVSKGFFTGHVAYNFGYNKSKAIQKIECKYNNKPLLGFGDSKSDFPILEASANAFAINNNIDNATRIDIVNHSINSSPLESCIRQILYKNY